jgi:hypothetical protein
MQHLFADRSPLFEVGIIGGMSWAVRFLKAPVRQVLTLMRLVILFLNSIS